MVEAVSSLPCVEQKTSIPTKLHHVMKYRYGHSLTMARKKETFRLVIILEGHSQMQDI